MMHNPVIGMSPFETPDVRLVEALAKAGAVGVLDLGRHSQRGREALRILQQRRLARYGVRIPDISHYVPEDLSPQVNLVILDADNLLSCQNSLSLEAWRQPGRQIWVQVCARLEAEAVIDALQKTGERPDGLVVKGAESGGRVGSSTSFILLQEIKNLNFPFWVQGGIGPHSAAACMLAGASAIVLDSQLALLSESSVSEDLRKALQFAEGTETRILHSHQIFSRPDLKIPHDSEITPVDFKSRLGSASLKDNFIPAGQDICFAKSLAERYLSLRTLVHAMKRAIKGHMRQAKAMPALLENGPMARSNQTRFSIAQGPMTRVSDRPEFIHAVAKNGALPFLALSLMRKDDCRKLLAETAEMLGDLPWGVGILGFVPDALQAEQLEVLADFQPNAVLIAGGRPSQTESFEKRGIKSFLHVPSPGLLKQFLKEGARRFVFEGRECGGHVGPRSSFILWETQIDILLASDAVPELEIFFAGGIHDAQSAAMVSALAAPLTARGAKVGVLIGTAYLFTEEAVASGAILQRFQDEALACDSTALLETAPGHATRCAKSPFVAAFSARKEELRAQQLDPKKIWSELEDLNVGRLRIASKGVERVGHELVSVDENRQVEEGLYMLGQVAQMRSDVCTMRSLHEDISQGSVALLASYRIPEDPPKAAADIAIIGMSCIFPGAPNLDTYWKNILSAADLITEVPDSRWNKDLYFTSDTSERGKSISKWGGFIDDIAFDPLEFGIPPNSMAAIEPTQLLSLKVAKNALADAGYASKVFDRERCSVIFGAEAGTDLASAYGFRAQFPQFVGAMPESLDEFLPSLSEDSFPGVLANVISGRIANRLDLGGSNYTVDAACASSLAALDLAVKELIEGESDMVLCGGADLHNSVNDYLMFSSVKALSPTGKSRPFAVDANGIVLAEGVAVIVLKRLEDAERDQDRVYAVIKGVGSSSDGKSLGLTAPRKEGQIRALHRAYERAGVDPSEIELVEAHGTGTIVGDRTELQTLSDVYSEAGALNRSCALGSVKSQIGHSKCAAGLAGVIKSSLAIYHGIIPPTLHAELPNPYYAPKSSPFFFSPIALPWTSKTRKAAVSAFGFGGTNFHSILVSHDAPETPKTANSVRSSELFLFPSDADLRQAQALLAKDRHLNLAQLAFTLMRKLQGRTPEWAIVAKDARDLGAKIAVALQGHSNAPGIFRATANAVQGKVAILFPGQGSQSLNMGSEIFATFPRLRGLLEKGAQWLPVIFPKGPDENAEARLKKTSNTQPALGLVDAAYFEILKAFGVESDMFAGHSYGELVALWAAGSLSFEDLLLLSEARAKAIETAAAGQEGSMAAVNASLDMVSAAIQGLDVSIANHNAPAQVVIAGEDRAIERALQELAKQGLSARKIPVSCAFHSPLVAKAEALFAQALEAAPLGVPQKPIYSNTTATVHDSARLKEAYAAQIVKPVQFVKQVEKMYEDGARIFLEVGPGSVLKGLVDRILTQEDVVSRALGRRENSLEQLLHVIAELACMGRIKTYDVLFEGLELVSLDLDALLAQDVSQTLWLVNGHLSRPHLGSIPKSALKPGGLSLVLSSASHSEALDSMGSETREGLVKAYLQSMREMVEGQKQVMLQYLGSDQVVAAVERIPVQQIPAAPITEQPQVAAPQPKILDVAATVLLVVSQKTGYPSDMLGLDQDLEADLSIDSIKRFEILADLQEHLGDRLQESRGAIEKLAGIKTLRQLIAALEAQMSDGKAEVAKAEPPRPESKSEAAPIDYPVCQYLFRVEEAPIALSSGNASALKGRRFTILQDRMGVAGFLARHLNDQGAEAQVLADKLKDGSEPGPADGLILLSLLDDLESQPTDVFKLLQNACRKDVQAIIGVTGRGGNFGHCASTERSHQSRGISGLFKSLAKEFSDKMVKVIDLDLHDAPAILARQIFNEILLADRLVEVGYSEGIRRQIVAVPLITDLGQEKFSLDRNSVVLMLGGARGIAAQVATKLGEEYGCRFEIVGRTPMAEPEPETTAGIPDLQGLRDYFIRAKIFKRPAEIEAECRRILNDRDMRANFERLEALGCRPRYHCFDVRNKVKLTALIDQLYAQGRIDGVIHAAGVLRDSLILEKTTEAFNLVFETKVNPAEVLEEKLQSDVKFVALFSSVSGCFGNRGQTDYAAANNALDHVARSLGHKVKGRTLSINWGPWAGTGMVTTELEHEYRRRGIGLIPPHVGSQRFLDELRYGDPSTRQLVIMSGSPESFGFS